MSSAMKLMQDAVRECIRCEEDRQKKLLPGAPARSYTDARIAKLKEALAASEAEQDAALTSFLNGGA